MINVKRKLGIFGNLDVPLRISRGLPQYIAGDSWKYRVQFLATVLSTRVEAGEETALSLAAASIPAHAEISEIRATLSFTPDAKPATAEQKAVVVEGKNTKHVSATLDLPAGPSSLVLGMEDGDTIWTWAGRPKTGPSTFDIPDFAEAANAFLERAAAESEAPDQLITLQLTLLSDTAGAAALTLPEGGFRYRLVQPQGWTNELDDTLAMDRNLPVGFGEVVDLPLDPIVRTDTETVAVEELRLDVGGEFGEERLLGDLTPPATREFATIGDGFAAAQGFRLPEGLISAECVGMALGVVSDSEAEIYLEIQPDAEGRPAGNAPLTSGTMLIPPSDPPGSVSWQTGRFSEPVDLVQNDGPWWLIAKEIRGVVRIGLESSEGSYLGHLLANRGGQFWHDLRGRGAGEESVVPALVRLIHLPSVDTRSAGIDLIARLTDSPAEAAAPVTAKVSPGQDPVSVQLRFPEDTRARGIELSVHSHGEGTLSVANLVQVYRPIQETQ